MRFLERIISLPLAALWKITRFWQKPGLTPQQMMEKLPPEALARVQKEAEFLRQRHAVEVHGLAEGESPTVPRQITEQ